MSIDFLVNIKLGNDTTRQDNPEIETIVAKHRISQNSLSSLNTHGLPIANFVNDEIPELLLIMIFDSYPIS